MESLYKRWVQQVEDTLAEISTPIESILDYGCGQGTWAPVLAKRFPTAKLRGIDISEQGIIKAKERFPNHDFRIFNGSSAPFESESFDVVFSFHVLEHVADLKMSVADLARLVRRNGYIVAALPCGNEGSLEERLVRQIEGGRDFSNDHSGRFFHEDPAHLRRLSTDELVRLFAEKDVSLWRAFYADQLWGSIAWFTWMGTDFIRLLCDPSRARTPRAGAVLRMLRWFFIPLAFAMRVHKTDRLSRIVERDTKMSKRVKLLAVVPLKVLAFPLVTIIEFLASLEWRFRRTRPNGSAQYLILRRN